jgi:hypothetical protein
MYSKCLYPHAAGALVLAFFGETSVEWLQGGSVLMGVGMASIFATGKPAIFVSTLVAGFFVVYFLYLLVDSALEMQHLLCRQISST